MIDPAPTSNDTLTDKIQLEEFKVLRNEIELRATEQRSMERNTVLLSASIYGFLLFPKTGVLVYSDQPYLSLAWYLPPLFNFLALIRWRESVKMIEELSRYLMAVEQRAIVGGGWETHLKRRRDGGHLALVSQWYLLFWIVVIVGPLVVALIRVPVPNPHTTAIPVAAFAVGTYIVAAFVIWRSRI